MPETNVIHASTGKLLLVPFMYRIVAELSRMSSARYPGTLRGGGTWPTVPHRRPALTERLRHPPACADTRGPVFQTASGETALANRVEPVAG